MIDPFVLASLSMMNGSKWNFNFMGSAFKSALSHGCRCCTISELVKRNDMTKFKELLSSVKEEDRSLKDLNNALITASDLGRNEFVLALLESGADVNCYDSSGLTPVMLAALSNHTETVRILLDDKNCSLSLNLDLRSRTALHHAAATNNMELLTLLLERGADVNASNECKDTPLVVAIIHNNPHIIERLLLQPGVDLAAFNSHGRSALLKAVEFGDLPLVKKLIYHGADVGLLNNYLEGPLHIACATGNIEICRELLKDGALLEVKTKREPSLTPIMIATMKGHLDIVKLLIAHGAQVDLQAPECMVKTSTLCLAALSGRGDMVRYLLKNGANRELCVETDLTPMLVACRAGHKECVQVLLEEGFSGVQKNRSNWTPIRYAAHGGHVDVCELLFKNNPSGIQEQLDLAIQEALRKGHPECAKVLMAYKTKKEAEDYVKFLTWAAGCEKPEMVEIVYKGMSEEDIESMKDHCEEDPLARAIEDNYVKTAEKLLELGIPAQGIVSYGDNLTPLHVAIRKGNDTFAKLLLEKGADASGHPQQNVSPLLVAVHDRFSNMIDILLKFNTDVNFKYTYHDLEYDGGCVEQVMERLNDRILEKSFDQDLVSITALDLAMMNGDPEVVIKLIMHHSTNLAPLISEKGLWHKSIAKNPAFVAFVHEESEKPKTLKTLCRSTVHGRLRGKYNFLPGWALKKAKIEKLDLPKILEAYLHIPCEFDEFVESFAELDIFEEDEFDCYPSDFDDPDDFYDDDDDFDDDDDDFDDI